MSIGNFFVVSIPLNLLLQQQNLFTSSKMAPVTRKSTRARVMTTKAKQFQETIKKPVLRSITTIGEDENTYNNVNFKRRKLERQPEDGIESVYGYPTGLGEDGNDVFSSDEDDQYHSALSDYETDLVNATSTTRFLNFDKRPTPKEDNHACVSHSSLLLNDDLFSDHYTSDSDDVLSDSSENTPITPVSSVMGSFSDLKTIEENFQKIIEENNKLNDLESNVTEESSVPVKEQPSQEQLSVEDFLDYNNLSSEQHGDSNQPLKQKFLQYRHDERHNLAFPDVSTFPVRFEPSMSRVAGPLKKKVNSIRALKRRAILSGQASEMVGTGITVGDWTL